MLAATLDGTLWKMKFRVVETALPLWRTDVLRFERGRFTSQERFVDGFQAVAYRARGGPKGLDWTAVQENDLGEEVRWVGARKGEEMEGTLTWVRADGVVKEYAWSAKMNVPPRRRR